MRQIAMLLLLMTAACTTSATSSDTRVDAHETEDACCRTLDRTVPEDLVDASSCDACGDRADVHSERPASIDAAPDGSRMDAGMADVLDTRPDRPDLDRPEEGVDSGVDAGTPDRGDVPVVDTVPVHADHEVLARKVIASQSTTLVTARDGSFWGWGTNRDALFQPVGSRGSDAPVVHPQRLAESLDVREGGGGCVLAGPEGSGQVYCWGHGALASFGVHGSVVDPWEAWMFPRPMGAIRDVVHFCGLHCIRSDHTVWQWNVDPAREALVTASVDLASAHQGEVERCGPELGVQTAAGVFMPSGYAYYAEGFYPIRGIVDLQEGIFFSCMLLDTGRVMCWGRNEYGVVGNGFDGSEVCDDPLYGPGARIPCVRRPTEVVGLTEVVQIAVNDEATCARRRDGTVWCWGRNYAIADGLGPLGDGRPSDEWCVPFDVVDGGRVEYPSRRGPCRRHPVQVAGLADAVDISVGSEHQCAVRATGQVVCWGDNSSGQLGDGTTVSRGTPVPVRW